MYHTDEGPTMPRRNRKKRDPVPELPLIIRVRHAGKVVAEVVVPDDGVSLTAAWLTDYKSIPWLGGERERMVKSVIDRFPRLQWDQVYYTLWPDGGKLDA